MILNIILYIYIYPEVGFKDRVSGDFGNIKDLVFPMILLENKIISQKLGPRTVSRG